MDFILYERQDRVAIVTLNRSERANAQNPALLTELDAALDRATDDDEVRVIVLNATGKHFSAGHDMSPDIVNHEPFLSVFARIDEVGLLDMYKWEARVFLGLSKKWRNIPKPTICAVQGACVAAGLMLCWPMDLIIAAENARFSDPVVRMGIGGVEYHAHTWEFGARKAKELLFTAGAIDAHEAQRLGMVNRVVPLADLHRATLDLANEIAQMHPHALMMAKHAVNQTLDTMGQAAAIEACFNIHSLGHANARAATGTSVTLVGLAGMLEANKPNAPA